MFEYCIHELQWRAQQYKEKGYVVVFEGDIVKSDTAVPEELRVELSRAIEKLEAMAQAEGGLDWHPGSDGKVCLASWFCWCTVVLCVRFWLMSDIV